MALNTSRLQQDVTQLLNLVDELRADIAAAKNVAAPDDTATQNALDDMANKIEAKLPTPAAPTPGVMSGTDTPTPTAPTSAPLPTPTAPTSTPLPPPTPVAPASETTPVPVENLPGVGPQPETPAPVLTESGQPVVTEPSSAAPSTTEHVEPAAGASTPPAV